MSENYKILIIDNDTDFHRKIRMAFRRNFEFEGAKNIQKGFVKIKQWKPDLILLDLNLEGNEIFQAGIKIIQAIKEVNSFTPIIVASTIPINLEVIENVMNIILEGAAIFLSKKEYNKNEWHKIFIAAIEKKLLANN